MKVKTLTAVVVEQLRLLEVLLGILKQETIELSKIHLDAIIETNSQKEVMAASINANAAPLQQALAEATSHEEMSANATLLDLAAKLKSKGNDEISHILEALDNTADQIRQVATINQEIAECFETSVKSSITLLSQIINLSHTYATDRKSVV